MIIRTRKIFSLTFLWLSLLLMPNLPVDAAQASPSQEEEIHEKQESQSFPRVGKRRHLRKAAAYGIVGIGIMFLGALIGTSSVGIIILVGGTLLFFYGAYHLIQWISKGGMKKKKKKRQFQLPKIFERES